MTHTIKLPIMSVKYLVDLIASHGWTKTLDDIYIGGQLLAEVLPKFGDNEGELKGPQMPVPPALLADGSPDWSRMTQREAQDYREESNAYARSSATWARIPAVGFELSDKQLAVCQACIKHYAPRTDAEKAKDDKARRELPINEFTFKLLGALHLSAS